MKRQYRLQDLVYHQLYPNPTTQDAPDFHQHLVRNLIPEVRIETHRFYGGLELTEAKYPGLNYAHPPHRMRLGKFQHHSKLFAAFDALRLTPYEIHDLCKWEGTLWARNRYERDEGIAVKDTTCAEIRPWVRKNRSVTGHKRTSSGNMKNESSAGQEYLWKYKIPSQDRRPRPKTPPHERSKVPTYHDPWQSYCAAPTNGVVVFPPHSQSVSRRSSASVVTDSTGNMAFFTPTNNSSRRSSFRETTASHEPSRQRILFSSPSNDFHSGGSMEPLPHMPAQQQTPPSTPRREDLPMDDICMDNDNDSEITLYVEDNEEELPKDDNCMDNDKDSEMKTNEEEPSKDDKCMDSDNDSETTLISGTNESMNKLGDYIHQLQTMGTMTPPTSPPRLSCPN